MYANQGRVHPRAHGYSEPKLWWLDGFTWDFYGSAGYIHVEPRQKPRHYGCEWQIFHGRNQEPEPIREWTNFESKDHYANFIEALRAGKRELLNSELEEGHLSGALCELANISNRVGRELRFDPAEGRFEGDEDANRLLTRQYRKPFLMPDEV
jgi:hypothetical protein